ncbi:MAG: TatD family hydrolase [Candidatus Lokiarchaeota archaeon]|nr:TatD family hydrolase [Candidatus Lokiarchaeota archaeon]
MPKKINIPEPEVNLKFIDVHCHLPFPRPKKNDRLPSDEQQYQEFLNNGGIYLITSSIDNHTLELIQNFIKRKEKIGFTCGWAPQTVTYTPKSQYDIEWKKWVEYIQDNQEEYLAIGEIGLDFHHAKTLEKREQQVTELKKIFQLTKELNKPYVLHVRNAAEHEFDRDHPKHLYNKRDGATKEILSIIKEFTVNPKRIMWHCFSGPDEYGILLPKQGYTLSVPSSAYGINKWRRVIKQSPLNALVTETDSYYQHPYLRGPINVPLNVKYSIAAIAYTHNISQLEVSKITVENAIKFFNLEGKI